MVHLFQLPKFQLWFLVIQKSVIYLGLVRLFTKYSKMFTIANHKQPIIEVSMYAYKLFTVHFILLVEWTGHPVQCGLSAYAGLVITSKWAVSLL